MVISCWMMALFLVAGCKQESVSSGPENPSAGSQMKRANTSQGQEAPEDPSLLDPEPLYEESAILSPGEKQSLRLYWPPNKRFIYETSVIQRTSANDSPLADMIRSDAQQRFTYALQTSPPGPDGIQVIQVTYLSAKLMVDMVGNEMAYDSKRKTDTAQGGEIDEENPLRGLDALMGASIHIALDASGKIQQITGTGALLERLSQTIPGQLTSFYEGMIQEDQIQRLVSYEFLPENEVSAADQWESSTSQSMLFGQEATLDKNYTYLGTLPEEEAMAHAISFSEEISPRSTGEDSALPLIMKGGQGKGAILLSRENHILIAYQSIQKLSVGVDLPAELLAQMPKAGELAFRVIHSTRLLEEEDLASSPSP